MKGVMNDFVKKAIDELVSIGDFVVTGGGCQQCFSRAVVRQLKGVIKQASLEDESLLMDFWSIDIHKTK